MLAVRLHLRYGLSYRDLEELLAERGIAVDQVQRAKAQAGYEAEALAAPLTASTDPDRATLYHA